MMAKSKLMRWALLVLAVGALGASAQDLILRHRLPLTAGVPTLPETGCAESDAPLVIPTGPEVGPDDEVRADLPLAMNCADTIASIAGVDSAELSLDGVAWRPSLPVQGAPRLYLRMTAPAAYEAEAVATIRVGGAEGTWTVRTRAPNLDPGEIVFENLEEREPAALVASNTIPMDGFDGVAPVSVTGEGGPQISTDGGVTWDAVGTVRRRGILQLRTTTSASFLTPHAVTVTVGERSSTWLVTTRASDTAPASLRFTNLADLDPGTPVQSETLRVRAFDGPLTIRISGTGSPQLRVNDRPWATEDVIDVDDLLTLRQTTSLADGVTDTATLEFGQSLVTWRVSTRAADVTPDPIVFATVRNLEPNTVRTTAPATLSGFGGALTITVGEAGLSGVGLQQAGPTTPGELDPGAPAVSVNGGPWEQAATVIAGDRVQLRMAAPPSFNAARTANATIGDGSTAWTLVTRPYDDRPSGLAFAPRPELTPGAAVTSETVTLTEFEDDQPVSITGADNPTFRIDGGPPVTSGRIRAGQTLQLQGTAPAFNQSRSYSVSVGGGRATWTLTSVGGDADISGGEPLPFPQPPPAAVQPGGVVLSPSIRLGNFEGTCEASVSGPGTPPPGLVVNGAPPQSPVTVRAGDRVQIAAQADPAFGGSRSFALSICGRPGGAWELTTRPADLRPEGLGFVALEGQALATPLTSEIVTLTGFDQPVPVTVTGGEVSLNGGAWGSAGTIAPGGTLTLRTTSAAANATVVTVTVTAGEASATWRVKTLDPPSPPPGLVAQFVPQGNREPDTLVESNSLSLTGFSGTLPVRIAGDGTPDLSINGGPWVTSGTVEPRQSLRLRMRSAPGFSTERTVTVSIGETTGTWTVTTRAVRLTPQGFAPAAVEGLEPGAPAVSPPMTLTNFDGEQAVSISEGAELRIGTGPWGRGGLVRAGDTLTLRTTAPAGFNQRVSYTVTLATTTRPWAVATRALDRTPDALRFARQSGLERGVTVESEPQTLTGWEAGPLPLSLEGQGNPQMTLDDGQTWVTTASVEPGATLRLRVTAPATFNASVVATLRAGDGAASWQVSTRPQDREPVPFSFPRVVDSELGALHVSPEVTVAGFDGPLTVSTRLGGGLVSVDGGAFVPTAPILPGQRLRVQLRAPLEKDQESVTEIRLGSHVTAFAVATIKRDVAPDALAFAERTGLEPGVTVTSETVTVVRFEGPINVSVSGSTAQVSVNGGAWGGGGAIMPGQTLRLRVTAPPDFSQERLVRLTVGAVQVTWRVATRDRDAEPEPFAFADISARTPAERVTSETVSLAGFEPPITVTIGGPGGPRLRVNGGAWTTGAQVTNGDRLQLQTTSPTPWGLSQVNTVTVGTATRSWRVANRPQDTEPDPVAFAALQGQELTSLVGSQAVTLGGFDGPLAASVAATGATQPRLRVDGGAWVTSASVNPGARVELQAMTAAAPATDGVVTLNVGTGTATWRVATRARDEQPDPFAFPNELEQSPGQVITSVGTRVAGFDGPLTFTIAGAGSPQISVNGGAFADSVAVNPNDVLIVRLTSADFGGQRQATVTAGTLQVPWLVTTRPQPTTLPSTFRPIAFATRAAVDPNLEVLSGAVNTMGYDDPVSATLVGEPSAQFRIAGGSWTRGPATVQPGQSIQLRMTSSPDYGAARAVSLRMNGIAVATWQTVTRAAPDRTPDPFSFLDLTDRELGELITSNALITSGFEATVRVSIEGEGNPQLRTGVGSVANGWTTSASLNPGEWVQLRLTAAGELSTSRAATVRIDGVVYDNWSVRSRGPQETVPNPFGFTNVPAAPRDTLVESGSAIMAGYEVPVTVTVVGDGGAELSVNGAAWATTGTAPPGASLRLRLRSSPGYDIPRSAMIRVNNLNRAAWTVTTEPLPPLAPAARGISHPAATGLEPNTLNESSSWTYNNIGVRDVTVSGDGSPTFRERYHDGSYRTTHNVTAGEGLLFRLTTSPAFGGSRGVIISEGPTQIGSYVVRNRGLLDVDATPLTSILLTNQPLNAISEMATWNYLDGFERNLVSSITGDGSPSFRERYHDGSYRAVHDATPGEGILVRLFTPNLYLARRSAQLRVAERRILRFDAETAFPPDIVPDPINFAGVNATNQAPNALVNQSTWVYLGGTNVDVPVTIEGEGNPTFRERYHDGTYRTQHSVSPGEGLALRVTSSPEFGAERRVRLRTGQRILGEWLVTTRQPLDQLPTLANPASVTNAARNSLVAQAEWVYLEGFEGSLRTCVRGPGNPSFRERYHDGSYRVCHDVTPGEGLLLRATSSASPLTTTRIEIVVEDTVRGVWTITTGAN